MTRSARHRQLGGLRSAGLAVVLAVVAVLGLAAPASAAPPVRQLAPVQYVSFDGPTYTLVPWQGRHVTLLVAPGPQRSRAAMTYLVQGWDRAWEYYRAKTGRAPDVQQRFTLNGRTTIAEVPSTCGGAGAGCGYLGASGIEVQTAHFEGDTYPAATRRQADQAVFYELGRNSWFYDATLELRRGASSTAAPTATGFAVWMRFRSIDAARLDGAPFGDASYADFRATVFGLAGVYEADPSLTFAGTLGTDHSPGAYGAADFWASLMQQLADRHGGERFVTRFYTAAAEQPAASTTPQAVQNWVAAASAAACTDLSPVFYDRWGFPRPDGSTTARPVAASVTEPVGQCR